MSQIVKVGINVTRLGEPAVRKEPIVTALYTTLLCLATLLQHICKRHRIA